MAGDLREINLRANILREVSKNHVILKELSTGLSTLKLVKKHLQKRRRIFRRNREPSRIPARAQQRLSNTSRKIRELSVCECISWSTPN